MTSINKIVLQKLNQLKPKYKNLSQNQLFFQEKYKLEKIKINKYRLRIQQFIKLCKAVGASDEKIELLLKEIQSATNQIKIYQQQNSNPQEGWWYSLYCKIYNAFSYILKSIVYCLSFSYFNYFKEIQDQNQANTERLAQLRGIKKSKEVQKIQQQASKEILIDMIKKFEQTELSEIILFCQQLSKLK